MIDQSVYGESVMHGAVEWASNLGPLYPFVGPAALGQYDGEANDSGLFVGRGGLGALGAVARPATSPYAIRRPMPRVLSGFGAAATASSGGQRSGVAAKIQPVKVSAFSTAGMGYVQQIDVYMYPNYRVVRGANEEIPEIGTKTGPYNWAYCSWGGDLILIGRGTPTSETIRSLAPQANPANLRKMRPVFMIGTYGFGVWRVYFSGSLHPDVMPLENYEIPAYFGNHLITFVRRGHAPLGKGFGGFGAASSVPAEEHFSTEGTIVGYAAGSTTQTGTAEVGESFFEKNKNYIIAGVAGLAAVGLLFFAAKKKGKG